MPYPKEICPITYHRKKTQKHNSAQTKKQGNINNNVSPAQYPFPKRFYPSSRCNKTDTLIIATISVGVHTASKPGISPLTPKA